MTNVYEYLDEISIKKMVLPKIKTVFEKNQSDLKIMANVLQCIERTLPKLEKSQVKANPLRFELLIGFITLHQLILFCYFNSKSFI